MQIQKKVKGNAFKHSELYTSSISMKSPCSALSIRRIVALFCMVVIPMARQSQLVSGRASSGYSHTIRPSFSPISYVILSEMQGKIYGYYRCPSHLTLVRKKSRNKGERKLVKWTDQCETILFFELCIMQHFC